MTVVKSTNEAHRRRRNLRLLWISQFVNTTGLMLLVPIMPLHMEQLGADPQVVGLWAGAAIAAPALPLAVTTPLWGRLGDRIGRKWMVVRALAGLALAMLVMAFAPTPAVFLLARLLQGSVGGVVEAAASFVGAERDDDRQGSALGRSYSATAAGSLAGPIAGGFLVGSSYLPLLLTAVGAAAALMAVLCSLKLEQQHQRPPAHQVLNRTSGEGKSIRLLGWQMLLAAFFAYFGVYGLIPVFAEHVAQLVTSPSSVGPWTGVLHAVMWLGTFFGSFWWGRFNDRTHNPLTTLTIAGAITAVAIVGQAVIPWVLALGPLRFIQGFAFAALAQSVILHAGSRAPNGRQAEQIGLANSALLVGQFIGPLTAGALLAFTTSQLAVLMTGLAVALSVPLAALARRRTP